VNFRSLGPSRPVPLELEDAFCFSIFVLVSPDHDARRGRRLPLYLPHVSSISVGTGRCLSLCLLLVRVYERFRLFVSPFCLGLQVVLNLSPVLLIISLYIFI
jgi:hypothetical protein